jgi:hypothetical protein
VSKQHPVGGGEKHPTLDVVQRLLFPLELEPEETRQHPQRHRLDPVELGQHSWPRLLEVALRQHFELSPKTSRPTEFVVRGAAGRAVALVVHPQGTAFIFSYCKITKKHNYLTAYLGRI